MDKRLLITGASSEVGIQLLRKVCKDYSCIYLQYRNMNDGLEKALNEIDASKIHLIQADLSKEDGLDRLGSAVDDSRLFPNHVVHLPAPKAYNKQFHKDRWESYDLAWTVSVRSIVKVLQILLPYMSKGGYGRIVFMLTSYTINNPPSFQSSYVTVKYALLGLMKALSAEYSKKGVTVNGISPGMMETKFLSDIPRMIIEQSAYDNPIGRNVRLDEIIPPILYMLSDEGASMTGQNIAITGGR